MPFGSGATRFAAFSAFQRLPVAWPPRAFPLLLSHYDRTQTEPASRVACSSAGAVPRPVPPPSLCPAHLLPLPISRCSMQPSVSTCRCSLYTASGQPPTLHNCRAWTPKAHIDPDTVQVLLGEYISKGIPRTRRSIHHCAEIWYTTLSAIVRKSDKNILCIR